MRTTYINRKNSAKANTIDKTSKTKTTKKGKREKSPPRFPALAAAAVVLALALLSRGAGARPVSVTDSLSGCFFVVDAGHGGIDGGAVGGNGTLEAPLNLSVATFLASELRLRGATVTMTRTDKNAIGDTKREDMQKRVKLLSAENVTAGISIHMNKHTEPKPNGPRVYYSETSESSAALAAHLQHALDDVTDRPQKDAFVGDYMVLNCGGNTCVLVECGFLSNPEDEARLATAEYQRLLAMTIAETLEKHYGQSTTFPAFSREASEG